VAGDTVRLKRFLLAVLVWLPLAFIGWAVLGAVLDFVPDWLAGTTLTHAWPSLFSSVERHGTDFQVITTLLVPQGGRVGQLVFDLDPMMYGYGLPLYVALALATPISPPRRFAQSAIALLLVWLVQAIGLVTGALRLVVFDSGAQAASAAAGAGLSPEAVALCYQFAYLILPAVAPAVLWILLNRPFIESLGRVQAEPATR
jgi:hypothetical protein